MTRPIALAAFLAFSPVLHAQIYSVAAPSFQIASIESGAPPVSSSSETLPDAPVANVAMMPATASSADAPTGTSTAPMAGRYATIILPGQQAVPLHGMQKAVYGVHDSFNFTELAVVTLSAGWSHLINSAPHYGTNGEAFGEREGAAALRGTVQSMATDAVFSPMFHDDPRYYELGDDHRLLNRVVYAASRVVITRSSHSTQQRINAPLLLGYGTAAAVNNLYYPDRDTGAKQTFQSWGTSLAGAALGFEVDEFLDDALKIVHLRKK
jgi:hypothetical protein